MPDGLPVIRIQRRHDLALLETTPAIGLRRGFPFAILQARLAGFAAQSIELPLLRRGT